MPLVIVRYNRGLDPTQNNLHATPADFEKKRHFSKSLIPALQSNLPMIVAEELDVPGHDDARLVQSDIAVSFEQTGEFDQNVIDFSIRIIANDYPERRVNMEERKNAIIARLKSIMPPGVTTSVWLLLAPGAYGIFGDG